MQPPVGVDDVTRWCPAGVVSLDGAPVQSDGLERMVRAVPFLKMGRVGVWRSDDAGLLRELSHDSPDTQIVQALFARHGTDCPRRWLALDTHADPPAHRMTLTLLQRQRSRRPATGLVDHVSGDDGDAASSRPGPGEWLVRWAPSDDQRNAVDEKRAARHQIGDGPDHHREIQRILPAV